MKVSELDGAQLDLWVARAEGKCYTTNPGVWGNAGINELGRLSISKTSWDCARYFEPSSNWAHGGPIVERNNVGITTWLENDWCAAIDLDAHTYCDGGILDGRGFHTGKTPLVAAMRAYVASKFGDEVPGEEPAK